MNDIDSFVRDYVDISTANALDLPVEQVRVVNQIERNNEAHGAFSVEQLANGVLCVEYIDDDDWSRTVHVERDGYLDWTLGGALPEIKHWNEPRA